MTQPAHVEDFLAWIGGATRLGVADASDLFPLGSPHDVERWVEDLYTEPDLATRSGRFSQASIDPAIRAGFRDPGHDTRTPNGQQQGTSDSSGGRLAGPPPNSLATHPTALPAGGPPPRVTAAVPRKRSYGDVVRGLSVAGAIAFSAIGWWGLGRADVANRRANDLSTQRSQATARALEAEASLASLQAAGLQTAQNLTRARNLLRVFAWQQLDPATPLAMGMLREIDADTSKTIPGLAAAAMTALHTPLAPRTLPTKQPIQAVFRIDSEDLLAVLDSDRRLALWSQNRNSDTPVATLPGTFSRQAIAADTHQLVAGSIDGTIYQVTTGEQAPTIVGHVNGAVTTIVSTPNAVITGSAHGLVQRWPTQGEPVTLGHAPGVLTHLTADPAGHNLLYQTREGTTYFLAEQSEPIELATPSTPHQLLLCGPNAQPVVRFQDQVIRYRSTGQGLQAVPLATLGVPTVGAVCGAETQQLWLATADTIEHWDLDNPTAPVTRIPVNMVIQDFRVLVGPATPTAMAFDAEGRLQVWDLGTHQLALDTPTQLAVIDAQVAGDLAHAALLDRRGHVRLLGLDTDADEVAAPILGTHREQVTAMTFNPDGTHLVTATGDHTAHLWSLDTQTAVDLAGHTGAIKTVAFSGLGSQVLLGSADHTASLWDLSKQTPTSLVFRGHRTPVTAAALDRDGGLAATASADGALRVWNTQTQSATVLRTGGAAIHALAIDPAGAWLVSADAKGTLTRWPLNRVLAAPAVHTEHRARVNAIVFHPDGKRFATASDDQTVRLWPLDPDKYTAEPRVLHHTSGVRNLAFIDDGQKLVTTCEDGSIWTWPTVNSGKPSVVRAGELASLATAIVRPGGLELATLHDQRQIRVWPQNPANMIELLWDLPVSCPPVADRQRLLGDDLEAATETAASCQARLQRRQD